MFVGKLEWTAQFSVQYSSSIEKKQGKPISLKWPSTLVSNRVSCEQGLPFRFQATISMMAVLGKVSLDSWTQKVQQLITHAHVRQTMAGATGTTPADRTAGEIVCACLQPTRHPHAKKAQRSGWQIWRPIFCTTQPHHINVIHENSTSTLSISTFKYSSGKLFLSISTMIRASACRGAASFDVRLA